MAAHPWAAILSRNNRSQKISPSPAFLRKKVAEGRMRVLVHTQTVPAAFPYYLVAPPETQQPPAACAPQQWLIAEFARKK
jgi:hypothetical protein